MSEPTWDEVGSFQRELAALDVTHGGSPRPRVLGARGPYVVAAVELRPFERGGAADPVLEALALLLPMGCDRISVALPGRAWSLEDPIAPVGPDGDLRQRVLAETRVDGHDRTPPRLTTPLHPFALGEHGILWDPERDLGPASGTVPTMVRTLVARRGELTADADVDGLLEQLARLDARGHLVAVSERGLRRLGRLAGTAPLPPRT